MTLGSIPFLGFLLATVCVYYLMPKTHRWTALFAASLAFYASYDWKMAAVVLVSGIFAYSWGRLFDVITVEPARKYLLIFALCLNYLPLAAFKYFNLSFGFVPLGISFYTMQAASYIIDVYNRKYPGENNVFRFLLFITFFPQVVQGPINRFDLTKENLFRGQELDAENLRAGLQLMLWGLLRKVFVADMLRPFVDSVFRDYTQLGGAIIFLAVALYCVQLYADFSGGIDVARGAAKLFGIDMAQNFRQPYLATSLEDFWRRWHMSLSAWMRDYVFYPLALSAPFGKLGRWSRKTFGRERGKTIPVAFATVATFLAVGVWQGPGWSNVAYGLWNGGLMSASLLLAPLRKRLFGAKKIGGVHRVFGIVQTMFVVIIGRYFSRSPSLAQSLDMLKRTAAQSTTGQLFDGTLAGLGLTPTAAAACVPLCVVWLLVSLMRENGISPAVYLAKKPALIQFAVLFVSLSTLIVFMYMDAAYVASDFIYQGLNR